MSSKNIVSEDKFNNKWGFVISCIGSSVGMANIWMFPYRIGEFGGAAFLIPYIIFVLLIGFTGVIGEMAFGRAMHSGPLGAFKKAFDMKSPQKNSRIGSVIGLIPVIGSLGIAIGYSVIIGWILKFLADSITGTIVNDEDPAQVFTVLSQNFGSIPWHLLGLVLTLICMSFGIARGIEKKNRIMMPAFFVLFLFLALRVAFLDGAADGYAYLFKPDWSAMTDPQTWVYHGPGIFLTLYRRQRNRCIWKLSEIRCRYRQQREICGFFRYPCRTPCRPCHHSRCVCLRHGAEFRPGASLYYDSCRHP